MKKSSIQKICLILSDILSLYLSLMCAVFLLNHILGLDVQKYSSLSNLGLAKLLGLSIIFVFWYQEQYVKRRPVWEELLLLYKTIAIFAILHFSFTYLFAHHIIKLINVVFWVILLVILPGLRYITRRILLYLNLWQRDLYIVGTGDNALAAAKLLGQNTILGYKLCGLVTLTKHTVSSAHCENSNMKIFSYDELIHMDKAGSEIEIIFALPMKELLLHADKINLLQAKYTFVSVIPDMLGLPLYGVEIDHFFGNDQVILRLQNNLSRRINRIVKRTMDIVLSVVGLITLSPLFLLFAIFIKYVNHSRVFFKHKRIGREGKEFYCIKFQTMYPNSGEILSDLLANDKLAKEEWEKDFKLKNDPRVTPIGAFLRKTSLDELPQLWNVLLGEMSLVGPRPIVHAEKVRYNTGFYYYQLVRPGITGLWQISGRNDINYNDRVRLDTWYVKNWSLWHDFIILIRTIVVVIARKGAY